MADSPQVSDQALLDRAAAGDREAGDLLIRRFANLVYGSALRQTGDPDLTADISQAVFIVFVRRIRSIRSAQSLPSWLLKTTHLVVRDARRSAIRREFHERHAARPEGITMKDEPAESRDHLALIDQAILSLSSTDRSLILLRFIQGREYSAIAADAGLAEPAVRKRISRAIEKIRHFFAARGAAMSLVAVAGVLQSAGAQAAPAAVVQGAVMATSGASVGFSSVLAKSVIKGIQMQTLKWIACGLGSAVVVVTAVAVLQSSGGAQPIAQQPPPPPASVPAPVPTTAPQRAVHPAHQAVETFLAAAARNDVQAAQAVSMSSPPLHLDDTTKMLKLNGAVVIDAVEADATTAIVISHPIADDRGRVGMMLVTLRPTNGRWQISDIDFETPQSLPAELQRFRQQHPDAVRTTVSPSTQPASRQQ